MLNNHNFNIAIDASMSLGAGDVCDPNKDIIEAAKNAAKYEIEVLENLAHHNINVNRIYLDGPLLRLLKYTKKDHSCNRTAAGGRNVVQSVAILDHYMKTIKQRFPAVDFFIIVNLINWKQGPYSPYYGTLAYDFNKVFRVFLRQYKAQSEYKLAGIQIDTPWHTIRNRPNEYLERLNMINRVMQIELGSTESKSMTLSIVTNSAPNNNYEKAGFFAYKAIPQNKYSRTIPYSEWCARPVNFELGNNCYTNDLKMYNDQWNFMRFVLDSYNSDTRLMNFEKLEIAINSWYASPRNIVSAMVENSESYNYIERTYKQMSDYRAMENKTNP